MTVAEVIPRQGYRVDLAAAPEEILPRRYRVAADRISTSRPEPKPPPRGAGKKVGRAYSDHVRRQFFAGASILILSGSLSLAGVVFESDVLSVSGAITLAISLLTFLRWYSAAHVERQRS